MMRMDLPRILAVTSVAIMLGCGKERTESQPPPEPARPAQPLGETARPRESRDTIANAETVEGIWTQIAGEQEKISALIESGQLKAVHYRADRIGVLTVALADKAVISSPETAPRLKNLVEQVNTSARDLGAVADAGDLKGTEMEAAKLNAILAAVKATVGLE